MFPKKLICLILSLVLSLSSILSVSLTFSFDASDFFDWSSFDPDNLDEGAKDALEISRQVVKETEADIQTVQNESTDQAEFVILWNYIFKKYIFEKCDLKGLYFERSKLYLNEDMLSFYLNNDISAYETTVRALYSLADKLLKRKSLCDELDIEKIQQARNLAKQMLMKNGMAIFVYDSGLNFLDKDLKGKLIIEPWTLYNNCFVAKKIYEKLLKFYDNHIPFMVPHLVPFDFIDVSSYTVLFGNGEIVDSNGNAIYLNFDILWNSVMGCFIFDKIRGYQKYKSHLYLDNLNVNYVCLLHEFVIKLSACNRLYPREYQPYLNAAIELTEKIEEEMQFNLSDNYYMGNLKNTNWCDNKELVENIFKIIKQLDDISSRDCSVRPAKRSRGGW